MHVHLYMRVRHGQSAGHVHTIYDGHKRIKVEFDPDPELRSPRIRTFTWRDKALPDPGWYPIGFPAKTSLPLRPEQGLSGTDTDVTPD